MFPLLKYPRSLTKPELNRSKNVFLQRSSEFKTVDAFGSFKIL